MEGPRGSDRVSHEGVPVRTVRYNVVSTLDGNIAGPNGEYDWIPEDDAVDFAAIFARVDTVLLGRRSYELVRAGSELPWSDGSRIYVFSRTMAPEECPGATRTSLSLAGTHGYPSGMVTLTYDVTNATG